MFYKQNHSLTFEMLGIAVLLNTIKLTLTSLRDTAIESFLRSKSISGFSW